MWKTVWIICLVLAGCDGTISATIDSGPVADSTPGDRDGSGRDLFEPDISGPLIDADGSPPQDSTSGRPQGALCTSDAECISGLSCVCADATCATRKCNATDCPGCVYTSGDGACTGGYIDAWLDPDNACQSACNGSGACQSAADLQVNLKWDRLFDGKYAYHVVPKSGGAKLCKDMGTAATDVYDGTCSDGPDVPLADVAAFRFYTTMDCWVGSDCTVGMIEVPYTGQRDIYAHEHTPVSCPNLAKVDRSYRRHPVKTFLADPDVFVDRVNGGCRLLIGGTTPTKDIRIYSSTTAMHSGFSQLLSYDPSAVDPQHTYCWIWGATIDKVGGLYVMQFSSHRVGDTADCPPKDYIEPMGFAAYAKDSTLQFGVPKEIRFPQGNAAPRSWAVANQQLAVRIDNSLYYDPVGQQFWMPYVWFNWINGAADPTSGNWIASCSMNDPTNVINHVWPKAGEGHVTEGGELYRHGAHYFLFFSTNPWDGPYGMKYLRDSSITGLTRAGTVEQAIPFYTAVNDPADPTGGYQVDAAGAPAIVEVDGETYLYYHILRHVDGVCNNPDNPQGHCRRDTVVSRIEHAGNNHVFRLNGVELSWPAVSHGPPVQYSLGIQLLDGSWVGPCIHAGIVGSATRYRYSGVCSDLQVYPKGEIQAFRVAEATDGVWGNGDEVFNKANYDGVADSVTFGAW